MKAKASKIFSDLRSDYLGKNSRIKVLEGGSRSSKTWSIIQFLIVVCQDAKRNGKPITITIARQKLTWLKATILKDFKKVLTEYELWDENMFHKSEMTYNLLGSEIGFFGLDEPQKLHGRKQDVAWYNEAMECSYDDFAQLMMRTTGFMILDYNPSATSHWIYDRVLVRDDCYFSHSTWRDNPFLEDEVKKEIMSYEPTPENVLKGTADEVKWKIYGLGEKAQIEGVVFTNYGYVKEFPNVSLEWIGLDFGFTNDPTAIVKVCQQNGEIYAQELCYKRGMTNSDISNELKRLGIGRQLIVADSAEPKSIEELRRFGWNIIGVTKGAGSVNLGIDILKRYRINITEASVNFKREIENYTWRKDRSSGTWLNVPIDNFNHLIDALRFVAMETLQKKATTARPMTFGNSYKNALK